jgi:hypothetical protein
MFKEAIRRVYFALVYLGLADEEIEATTGTWKYRFLDWLYGNGEPMFVTQLPDEEEK